MMKKKIIEERKIYGKTLVFSPHFNADDYEKLISKFKASTIYKNFKRKPEITHLVTGIPDGDWFSEITFLYDYTNDYQWQIHRLLVQICTWFKENAILESEKLFVVRKYDRFNNEWMDVSEKVSKEEADRIWNEKTKNGTEKTCYNDIDYFRIYPV